MPEFSGNMGQPESVSDYKAWYGAWPPGIDDSIAPLTLTSELNEDQITKIARLYLDYRTTLQWYEVHRALRRLNIPLTGVFEKAKVLNDGKFPNTLSANDFIEKYGVHLPG